MIERGNFALPTLESFDAFTDNPYFSIWRPLAESYPEARFVLTVRDRAAWIESCVRFYRGRRVRPMRRWMFGAHADPSATADARDAWLARFDAHNAAVQAYFATRPGRLLVLDITSGDGWSVLCPFLGEPVPNRPFPAKKVRRASS
jgi:hypothetical protein